MIASPKSIVFVTGFLSPFTTHLRYPNRHPVRDRTPREGALQHPIRVNRRVSLKSARTRGVWRSRN